MTIFAQDINVVKEKFEEHVEDITADVENLKRQQDADRDRLTFVVEDLKRKLEAQMPLPAHENDGAKRPRLRAAPTKQVRNGAGGICNVASGLTRSTHRGQQVPC
jgi:hypothetical protein